MTFVRNVKRQQRKRQTAALVRFPLLSSKTSVGFFTSLWVNWWRKDEEDNANGLTLGSLSNDDDGYKNQKVNPRCLKRYRAYSSWFSSSNVGSSLELNSKIRYRESGKEKGSRFVFMSSTICEIMEYNGVVVQWRQRNVQKSVMQVRAELLFCSCTPIAFLLFSLSSPPSLLKLPINPMTRT